MNSLRISRWIIFAFALSSIPFFYIILKNISCTKSFWIILQENVSHGELIYISLPLYWISAGELFSSSIVFARRDENYNYYSQLQITKCFCIAGISIILAQFSTFLLCDYMHKDVNLESGAVLSFALYISSFICGLTSVRLHAYDY